MTAHDLTNKRTIELLSATSGGTVERYSNGFLNLNETI